MLMALVCCLVDTDINEVLDAIVAFTVVGAVDVVVVAVVVTAAPVAFCGHDLAKWPICLQCQHCGFRPSSQPPAWLAPHTQLCGGLPGTLPC